MPCLFAGYTSRLPQPFTAEEMILMSEGLEGYDAPERVPVESLSYQLVILSRRDVPTIAARAISDTWRERFDLPIHLELIEARLARMNRSVREACQALEADQFYVRPPIVAYNPACRSVQDMIRKHLPKALTRRPWQFWR